MSVALIVTRGFGNGTLAGSIHGVVTRGYSIGEVLLPGLGEILEPGLRDASTRLGLGRAGDWQSLREAGIRYGLRRP